VAFMGLGAVKEFATASLVAGLCKDVKIGNYSSRDLWDRKKYIIKTHHQK